MRTSSRQWKGYIQDPQILEFTPEKFADELLARVGFNIREFK
jgi:hypothetical protein